MRGMLLVVFASVITAVAAFFLFHREELSEIGEQKAGIGGLPNDLLPHPPQVPPLLGKPARRPVRQSIGVGGSPARPAGGLGEGGERGEGGRGSDDSPSPYLEVADKYLVEALPLVEPKDRFVLIEKINGFNNSYKSALGAGGDIAVVIRATARYIAAWNPFYYYIHPDVQGVLGPIIKMLESERESMLKNLAKQDARTAGRPACNAGACLAGRLATEDIEYYIEDIRKSAARRNSDFITFSLQDYEGYRKVFDELAQSHSEFLSGFAESAHVLFDDFYRMHEEVDMEYSQKTRKSVLDMHLAIRDLHKRALLDLGQIDNSAARSALAKTISVIESELSAHPAEINDIIKSDYAFYKNINL